MQSLDFYQCNDDLLEFQFSFATWTWSARATKRNETNRVLTSLQSDVPMLICRKILWLVLLLCSKEAGGRRKKNNGWTSSLFISCINRRKYQKSNKSVLFFLLLLLLVVVEFFVCLPFAQNDWTYRINCFRRFQLLTFGAVCRLSRTSPVCSAVWR